MWCQGEKKWTVMRSIGFAAETASTIGNKSDALKGLLPSAKLKPLSLSPNLLQAKE